MSSAAAQPPGGRPSTLTWACWAALLIVALVNALAPAEPFPYWSSDPSRFYAPPVGLTPFWSIALDLMGVLAAGAAIATSGKRGPLVVPVALGMLGAVGVSLQALVVNSGDVEGVRLGAAWLAAVLGAVAMAHLCRDERVRRVTIAVLLGVSAMLLAKGVLQVAVEHRATVERYRENRAAFLAANGWTADSSQARMFERRLNQAEATGWFGMSNVFATFAAGAFVALTGLSVLAWLARRRREAPDGWAGALSLGALGAGASVYLSHSKGGIGAAAVGLGILAVVALAARRAAILEVMRRRAGLLAVALVALALAGVALRGLIGERLGELSLLFRWFYVQGAARIFASHPLIGVGPAGFKDAYTVAKPPISPEEVVSAHSILWDYAATLGAFGIAWGGAFLWLVWRSGRESLAPAPPPSKEPRDRGGEGWTIFLVASGATLLAARTEIAAQTADAAVARFAGLVGWIGIAMGALVVMRTDPRWRWAAGAGVLAMAVHAQIEVTGFWAGAAPLLLITLGAMAAPTAPGPDAVATRRRTSLALASGTPVVAVSLWWSVGGLWPVQRWEHALTAAARQIEPFARLVTRRDELGAAGALDSVQAIARDAAALAGTPIAQNDEQLAEAFRLAYIATTGRAASALEHAVACRPKDLQTIEALARLRITRAQAMRDPGQIRPEVAQSLEVASEAARRATGPGSLGLLANTLRAAADLLHDPEYLTQARDVLQQADPLDPYGLSIPWRLFEISRQLGDAEGARRWGALALERDHLQRLDQEARGLTEAQRRQIQAALNPP